MNRFLKIGLITLVLAGALGGAGCKTKPKNITAIPGSEGRAGTTTELAPTGPIGTTPGGTAGRGNRFAPGDRVGTHRRMNHHLVGPGRTERRTLQGRVAPVQWPGTPICQRLTPMPASPSSGE